MGLAIVWLQDLVDLREYDVGVEKFEVGRASRRSKQRSIERDVLCTIVMNDGCLRRQATLSSLPQ